MSANVVDLSSEFFPTLSRHRKSSASRQALALLCRGDALGVSASAVAAWVQRRALHIDYSGLVELSKNSAAWSGLARRARLHVASSSRSSSSLQNSSSATVSPRALALARRGVAFALGGAEGGGASVVGARALVAHQALAALRHPAGIDCPLLPSTRVAVDLGVHIQTAKAWITLAREQRWLTRVGDQRKGSADAYRLGRLSPAQRDVAVEHWSMVEALAVRDVSDGPTEVFMTVDHPAWGYSSLGHRGWLVFLADRADVYPGLLGIPDRSAAAVRRTVRKAGLMDCESGQLVDHLDELARNVDHPDGSSPLDRWAAAEEKRAIQVADRKEAVVSARLKTNQNNEKPSSVRTMTVDLPAGFDGSQAHKRQLIEAIAKRTGQRVAAVRPVKGQPGKVQIEVE